MSAEPALPLHPRALTAHALRLAVDGDDPAAAGVGFRRSVSASYYAVFHAIALALATHLAPSSGEEATHRLARSLQHARLAEVCRWLAAAGGGDGREQVRPVVRGLRANPAVVELAGLVLRLQDARHEADYDHLATVGVGVAMTRYREALLALDLLDELRATHDGEELLALVALNTTLR